MSFSFSSFRPGGKLNDAYPAHIQNWASRLKASIESDSLDDLKEKYQDTPLRRATPKPQAPKKGKK